MLCILMALEVIKEKATLMIYEFLYFEKQKEYSFWFQVSQPQFLFSLFLSLSWFDFVVHEECGLT